MFISFFLELRAAKVPASLREFLTLMQGRGQVDVDDERLEDAIAFAGVAKFPARIKCALMSWMAWKDATVQSAPVEEQS